MRRLSWIICGGLIMATSASSSQGADVAGPAPFGKTASGEAVGVYTLKSKGGVIAKIATLGATVVELHAPDKPGKAVDVVLGFNDAAGYESDDSQYFGATVGRVANRIAKGKFALDGKTYQLAVNNGPNS